MNVLSCFDGISCGQVALNRLNIPFETYYASEIDKYAIKVTQKNHPKTKQLGDINNWKRWNLDWASIELLMAGFSCQSFSISGKQEGFKDPRGKLSLVLVDLLNYAQSKNPNLKFLFENVKMKTEFRDQLDELFQTKSVEINSALVSAQSRKRLYWTNIGKITQPENKHIYLGDILEEGCVDRFKSYCIDANYAKGGNLKQYFEKSRRQLVFDTPVRIAHYGKGGQGNRVYSKKGKAITLSAQSGGLGPNTGLYYTDQGYRKLTPIEAERLQTLEDDYTSGISNSQRYKCLGNGWSVDVIVHILEGLKNETL